MTYSVHPITSLSDIPSLVKSFADTLGWTTTLESATSITVKHPTYTGARVFGVTSESGGSHPSTSYEQIKLTCDGSDSTYARCISPKLNPTQAATSAAVVIVQPTKLHLFGNLSGGPTDSGLSFIAGVIEYGYNLYRHFYLGYLEKISAFDGGEVITGSACWITQYDNFSTGATISRRFDDYKEMVYPFKAHNGNTVWNNGGLYINHVGNAQPWREFAIRSDINSSGLQAILSTNIHKLVLGGFRDSINEGYMLAGKAPYSGVQVLTPINLYIGKKVGTTAYLQAVGRPAGVRLVHMEDLQPGDEITIGTSVWRVFAVFSKSSKSSFGLVSTGSGQYHWPTENSSHYVGLAYLVSA